MSQTPEQTDQSYFDELDELEAAAGGVFAVSPETKRKIKAQKQKKSKRTDSES